MGTFELINAISSLVLGGIMTAWSQSIKDRAEREKLALQIALEHHQATEVSQIKAREFQGSSGFHITRRDTGFMSFKPELDVLSKMVMQKAS